jgi:hypothetical protein
MTEAILSPMSVSWTLTWPKKLEAGNETVLLCVSRRKFPEEISTSVGKLSKAKSFPQCWWAPCSPLRVSVEQKAETGPAVLFPHTCGRGMV